MAKTKEDKIQNYYKRLGIQQLRGFYMVAKLGSVSKAAQQMHLTQPTVTLQLQALEEHFQATLFQRRGPRLTLTHEGKVLFKLVQPVIEGVEGLEEAFTMERKREQVRTLRIAGTQSSLCFFLPDLMKIYLEQYPEAKVSLHYLHHEEAFEHFRERKIDLYISTMHKDVPDDFEFHVLSSHATYLMAPLGHPLAKKKEKITFDDLTKYDKIMSPRYLKSFAASLLLMGEAEGDYNSRIELHDWEIVLYYVRAGLGIGFISELGIKHCHGVKVIPLHGMLPKRHYGVYLPRGAYLKPEVRQFLVLAGAHFKRKLKLGVE